MRNILIVLAFLFELVHAQQPTKILKVQVTQLSVLSRLNEKSTYINEGDSVNLIKPYLNEWMAEYKGRVGFIKEVYLKRTAEFISFKKSFPNKNTSSDLAKGEAAANANIKNLFIKQFGSKYGVHVANGRIMVGMTSEMVVYIIGEPTDKNKTITQYGTSEQWVYELEGEKTKYYYFDDDVLTAIQK